ncbi:MAG: hypothetical protein ORN98_09260, partial [Alphaproteobacteria bacterium]|nr:hypothetical protein [Alphaproteobacteria bacterium]
AVLTALKPTSILINNQVSMLLERQIMRPENANSPARRIYFAAQCAYMAETEEKSHYLAETEIVISEYEKATSMPLVKVLLQQIRLQISLENFYEALKLCNGLIDHEDKLMQMAKERGVEAVGERGDSPRIASE